MPQEPSTSPAIVAFAQRAEAFVALVEQGRFESSPDLRSLAAAIAEVYAAGLLLPDAGPPGDDEEIAIEMPVSMATLPDAYYWEVFDPLAPEPDAPVVGLLSDDIGDIYRDLLAGLVLYRQGEVAGAVWLWRLHQDHWGHHATDALRALQRMLEP